MTVLVHKFDAAEVHLMALAKGLAHWRAATEAEIAAVPKARIHEILVGALNAMDHIAWTTGWGDERRSCIMGLVGHGSGIWDWMIISSIAYKAEGIACARALGFSTSNDAAYWNDRIANAQLVRERLQKAIARTAPEPPEPDLNLHEELVAA